MLTVSTNLFYFKHKDVVLFVIFLYCTAYALLSFYYHYARVYAYCVLVYVSITEWHVKLIYYLYSSLVFTAFLCSSWSYGSTSNFAPTIRKVMQRCSLLNSVYLLLFLLVSGCMFLGEMFKPHFAVYRQL